jgi:hypothetical protein
MKQALSQTVAPVVILRWFADGAGYAYDAAMEAGQVSVISEALGKVFQTEPAGSTFSLPLASGGWIIGEKVADLACLDVKAAEREPGIVRAVLLNDRPKLRRETTLLEGLRTLPLPAHPGPMQLALALPQPPRIELPAPAQGSLGLLMQWGPAAAALAVVILDAYLQLTSGSAHSAVSWLWRVVIVASVTAIGYLCVPAQASQQDIREVESRLRGSDDDDENSSTDAVFSERACLVLPDGRRVRLDRLDRQVSVTGFGTPNLAVADSQYFDFLNVPGRATLIGKEKLRLENLPESLCWFIRHYERIRGRWRITFAQWTAVAIRNRQG